ncbi:MAG: DUF1844 domain-containing protein [Desulfobacteraceae bacterium]|nr:DUF1844 domain-containing protein [Desulfobacteraceae bacterium]MCF8094854.1 DUF1844 domain-containing protein [Desulfobacteraceae bacterium]
MAQDGTDKNQIGSSEYVMPEINFTTFILSLNSSALVHLGQHADPSTGATAKNLPVAKQTIDVIAMLEEKTRGNLTHEEQRLLTNVLYELRLLYVKETGGK